MRGATFNTLALAAAALVAASSLPQAVGQVVSYSGGVYSENFDSMGASGTTTVNGWYVDAGGNNLGTAPATYTRAAGFPAAFTTTLQVASDGTVATAGAAVTRNLGSTGDPDRAQGSGTTGRSVDHLLAIQNDTGGNLVNVNITYTGEQWRTFNAANLRDIFVMYYSSDGINFSQMGSSFNFTSPTVILTGTTPLALDGNQATNRIVGIGGNFSLPAVVAPGAQMYFAWLDPNPGSTDGVIAIDDVSFSSAPCEPVVITQQPVGTNVAEKGTIVLRVVTTGSAPTFQWVKDGVDIPGATGPTLTIPNANPDTMVANGTDNGMYKCRVGGACSATVDSTTVAVNVIPDTVAPTILYALAGPNLDVITVVFSESMDPDFPSVGGLADNFEWDVIDEDTLAVLTDDSIVVTNVNGGTNNGLHIVLNPGSLMNSTDKYRVERLGSGVRDTAEVPNEVMPPIAKRVSKFENLAIAQATFVWRYDDTGTDLGTAWKEVTYAGEAGMASGLAYFDGKRDGDNRCRATIPFAGPFVAGDPTVRTCITLSNAASTAQIPTVYLRGRFFYGGASAATVVARLAAGVDDGFIMYLNGTEVLRDGMSATAADSFNLLATRTQGDADSYARPYEVVLNLVPGDNVIAVSLHQVNLTSSDLTWGLQMTLVEDCPPVCVPVDVVQEPMTQTVNEGANVTFTVGVSGTPPYTFQWRKGGSDIMDATNSSLTLSNLCPDANGMYDVVVRNCGGANSDTSAAATLTVTPESTRPTVASVAGQPNLSDILVTYSEGMDATSAGNSANYSVSGGHAISGATVVNPTTVRLSVAPPLTLCEVVTVTIQNVTDDACIPNVLDPNPTARTFTVNAQTLVPYTASWIYNTNSQDGTLPPNPGPAWFDPLYVPGADWQLGNGMFGLETSAGVVAQFPAPINTPLVSPPNSVTPEQWAFFFRQNIVLPAIPAGVKYVACHFIDDGAAFYLDGAEIGRVNLSVPAPIIFTNQANAAIEASLQCFEVNTTAGAHLLAAEVHQNGAGSSDVLFGLEIRAVKCPPPITITYDAGTGIVTVTWTPEPGWVLADSSEVSGIVDDYDPTVGADNAAGTYSTVANPPANRFYVLLYTGRP